MPFPLNLPALAGPALALLASLASDPVPPPGARPAVGPTEDLVPVSFEGLVLDPAGAPARGAIVVSSAGGQGVADDGGWFRLRVEVPLDAESVQVTAVGRSAASPTASARVALPTISLGALRTIPVGPLVLAVGTGCSPRWLPTFGGEPGFSDDVYALAAFDDGGGPALYAGGAFTTAGGVVVNRIAKWDGSSWVGLGGGVDSHVKALAVYDDGGGPALFAGGGFSSAGGVAASRVAKWDGSSWSALGSGVDSEVLALAVHDDGSGAALFVGGHFASAGGTAASRIARWNGSTWAALGSGLDQPPYALATHDDGTGPALFVGGVFTLAGGIAAGGIARWSGAAWSALGGGTNGAVYDLLSHDDGGGPALYVAGSFSSAGAVAASNVARWNGSWSSVGTGSNPPVLTLVLFDDGSGPALHAGSASFPARVTRWDGAGWSDVGGGLDAGIFQLLAFDDGSGPALYAGGAFQAAGTTAANRIARWGGTSWSAMGGVGLNRAARALAVHDDGSGPALYAGGAITSAGGALVSYVARWNGTAWSSVGAGTSALGGNGAVVHALRVFDDGSGAKLYAGGQFTVPGNFATRSVARWDGSTWGAVGSSLGGPVHALEVYNDGSGPRLYAGGAFPNGLAKWSGSVWTTVSTGLNGPVHALAVYVDGAGSRLYAGGDFTSPAQHLVKTTGAGLFSVGNVNGSVFALAVHDDGSGPALFVGGAFSSAGGVPASRVARWNGTSWSSLASGMPGAQTTVRALVSHDEGGGLALYAAGDFQTAGGMAANRIARWDGSSWSALGSGLGDADGEGQIGRAFAVYDDGSGAKLCVGGSFSAADSGDSHLARWGCPPPDTTAPVITCSGDVERMDRLWNGLGEVVHFTVTATDDEDPAPSVQCVPPSGSTFPPGTTQVQCSATDASGNTSSCQFAVTVVPKARRR